MQLLKLLLLFSAAGFLDLCNSYRILGLYPFPGKSHYIMMNQLFKGLARKGHQVDVITPFKEKENITNYNQIFLFPDKTTEIMGTLNYNRIKEFTNNRNSSAIAAIGTVMCNFMGMPEFLNLARNPPKDPPYDIIILQAFNYHCLMILGHLWNVPVVLVSTTALYPWMHDMIGNPENIAFSPNNMSPALEKNDLVSRLHNAYMHYLIKFAFLYYSTEQNEALQKYFGPNVPTIRELESSASLILMNTYFPINGVKPMTTGVVEVGGLHIQNDGPELPGDLKKWLDESKQGVIYFTLGSILRVEIFPEETIKIIFESLEKLAPTRVLMRIVKPEELTVKIPSNFRTLSWMPQEKILQHPNVKLFITHGGLLGSQESVFYGVPMFCLPVLADQRTNTQNYVSRKIAVTANIMSLTKESFDNALKEVLHDPEYKKNAKRLSKLFKDRPQSAMDTAAFWIEFVARNGKDVLRSPAMDLTWWQVALLDVLAITLLGLFIIIFIMIVIVKTVLRLVIAKKTTHVSKLDKKRN